MSRKEQDYVRYKAISNSVRQMTRQDHQAHVEEIAASLEKFANQRPFWSWLKKTRKNDDEIPQLYNKNKVHTSNDEKAEALNEYIQAVFTKEATGNLQQVETRVSGEQCSQSFDFRFVRTITSIRIESGLDRVRTILSRTTETECVLCGYWLSRLHTQALVDRDREQTLTSKMIAHSRKAVDEDGRLCFVFFLLLYFIITNKN